MSPADDTTEIDTKDTKESKLEVSLGLAKFLIISVTSIWGGSVVAQFIGIENELVTQLLPIVTGFAGTVLGYIIGKQE